MKRMVIAGMLVTCFLLIAGCTNQQVPQSTTTPTMIPTVTINQTDVLNRLPSYAFTSADITEAYLFATEHPDALNGVECHCSCMERLHEGRLHSRGLLDCYFWENGTYDIHASLCNRCVADTLEVRALFEKGMSKEAINQTLEAKYEPSAISASSIPENCSVLVTVTTSL